MPNYFDFTKLDNTKEILVNPKGWINPLVVQYGVGDHADVLSYFWRIKGTKHTFIIPVIRMDCLSEGNYNNHFEESLESFRDEYIEWYKDGFYTDWMKEYNNEYKRFISI